MVASLQVGMRVEVQFGKNKLYSGLVLSLQNEEPGYRAKPILSIIDEHPILFPDQLKMWQWMANYYCCTLGEVMMAALPAGMKLASETRITLSPLFDDNYEGFSDKEYMIAEALSIQEELSIGDIQDILGQKTVYPLINKLLDRKIIYLKEELKTKYKPKEVWCVRLQEPYASEPNLMEEAFAKVQRAERQAEALLAYVQLSRKQEFIRSQDIYDAAGVNSQVLRAMEKKGIFELYQKQVSRLGTYDEALQDSHPLTPQQERVIEEIRQDDQQGVSLLHGVTGSGKTRVYIELIQEAIERGEQVLYLLPEIALTAQLVSRLQKIFGEDIAVYHSRLNNPERVEIWQQVCEGKPIVMGARSSLFLPFQKLRLVIVDEEHDTSYKQIDPAPRYNARDLAVYLAHQHGARVILGTATPSIESYYNAKTGKYALIEMPERFGGIEMPEIVIVDARDELKKKKMQSHFTSVLIDELRATLERGDQAILFQNRRGFAPTMRCTSCGWHSECIHCDVSLTYHKFHNNLRCHYCGYQSALPQSCPACGSRQLTLKGFGTEKIEDDLKIFFPEARIGRMDFDTVRTKNAHAQIINDFEEKRIDILVGTQMVTKGLDFDNVGVVGVLSADHLFQFPDFRASERGFQLITQVSGRAGRKHRRGRVIIQAFNPGHPALQEILANDYPAFFARELSERHEFLYPPYNRLIKVTLKHKKPDILNEAAKVYAKLIKKELGVRVNGPALPSIPRVRSYFLIDFLLKIEKKAGIMQSAKNILLEAAAKTQQEKGFSSVRINIDVDPY